ncbi:MAG: patatin-like phospholipase family protein [Thioalkalivibrio sp.]
MTSKQQKNLSLVLSSGGARGLAQIGVIHWLEENRDFKISSISGCSMGALIGGIHAAGKLDIYEQWVTALSKRDVFRLLDFSYSWSGLFSGDRLISKLRDMLGEINIEDLPVSFTAVATDLENSREVWLSEGPLFDAIRASIAIPTVFTPFNYKGRLLVDGGLINPVPIAPTLRDNTDLTVAVNLNGRQEAMFFEHEEPDTQPDAKQSQYQKAIANFIEGIQDRLGRQSDEPSMGMLDVVSRSIETMQNNISRFRMAAYNPDYLIEIPVNACGLFDFHRAQEMIDLGYERAEKAFRDKD